MDVNAYAAMLKCMQEAERQKATKYDPWIKVNSVATIQKVLFGALFGVLEYFFIHM